jgi:hypothetical protein
MSENEDKPLPVAPRQLGLRSLDEIEAEYQRVRGLVIEARGELARLQSLIGSGKAELEKVTAQVNERRQEHVGIEASIGVITKHRDEMLRNMGEGVKGLRRPA